MKREIKFIAWDKKRKSMFVPDSFVFDASTGEVMSVWRKRTNGETIGGLDPRKDRLVLMQYTGLTDKNGREIYESDIVKMHQVVLSPDDKIGWVEYTAQYGYSIRFGNRRCMQSDWANDEGAKYEVIGNIYENPELMEASK